MNSKTRDWLFWLLPILAILGLAVFLRLVFFTGLVRSDDLNYAHAAYELSEGRAHILEGYSTAIIRRIGLYGPVALLYLVFGPSETLTIIYPLFLSLLGVVFVYGIGWLLSGEAAGLIAALLWTLFPAELVLATDLLPDGPVAATIAGSIFFLLLAEKKQKGRYYIISALLFLWAFSIKTLSLVIGLVILSYAFTRIWKNRSRLWKEFTDRFELRRQILLAACIGIPLLGIVTLIISQQSSDLFLERLLLTRSDILRFFLLGKGFFDTPFRTSLFDVMLPMVLVAATVTLIKPQRGAHFLHLWMAVQFIYLEWGSLPRRLRTGPFIEYSPIVTRLDGRNFNLFVLPLVIIVGIYLARGLSLRSARNFALIGSPVLAFVAWLAKPALYNEVDLALISLAAIVVVFGSVLSPAFIFGERTNLKTASTLVLTSALVLAMLKPTPPYHPADLQKEQVQFDYARQSLNFIEKYPEFPVITNATDLSLQLNIASNFELGYNWRGLHTEDMDDRILDKDFSRLSSTSALIVIDKSEDHPNTASWWKIAEFGAGSRRGISIYRALSPSDADEEYKTAEAALTLNPSEENLRRYYGAAVNAEDFNAIVETWGRLNVINSDEYVLEQVVPILLDFHSAHAEGQASNLFSNAEFVDGVEGWRVPEGLDVDVSTQETSGGSGKVLHVRINEKLEEDRGISQVVLLKPNTAYAFQLEIWSTSSVDALLVQNGVVKDSHDFHDVFDAWQTLEIFFITPNWNGQEQEIDISLFAGKKPGEMKIRRTFLSELRAED